MNIDPLLHHMQGKARITMRRNSYAADRILTLREKPQDSDGSIQSSFGSELKRAYLEVSPAVRFASLLMGVLVHFDVTVGLNGSHCQKVKQRQSASGHLILGSLLSS